MEAELEAEAPGAIALLGVGAAGEEAANTEMVSGRVLPWLQDTADANVWVAWQVTYRDVFVLDAKGEVRFVYNLTDNDLAKPGNYHALKTMLLDVR